jgi:hypothetical protein
VIGGVVMLADALEVNDVAILNAAMSAEPVVKYASPIRPCVRSLKSGEGDPLFSGSSRHTSLEAARGTTTGVLVGGALWLVIFVVAFIGH